MEESYDLILDLIKENPGMELRELVDAAAARDLGFDEASRAVYWLWKEGRVNLEDSEPPRNPLGFLLSHYSAKFWLSSLALLLMVLYIYVVPDVAPHNYIRAFLGFLTALYLPGSALIEALYPKEEELEPLERMALSVGLSIAVTPLIGFVLNYTPWGIRLVPITVSVIGVTLLLGLAAVYRKFVYFRLRVESLDRVYLRKVAVER